VDVTRERVYNFLFSNEIMGLSKKVLLEIKLLKMKKYEEL